MKPTPDLNPTALAAAPARAPGDSALTDAERALLDQIRQRTRTPLIIERPEGVLSARRMTNTVLTMLWWSVWLHFMLPLATLLLWMSGFKRFSQELLGRGGLDALMARLPLYLSVITIVCGALIGWALINWWRFAQSERRRSSQPVQASALAHSYGIDPSKLANWQKERRLVVAHDEQGRPTGPVSEPGAPALH